MREVHLHIQDSVQVQALRTRMTEMHPAHSPHSVPGIKPFNDVLYVVTAISNPSRYLSRYRHYREFEKHIHDSGAILYTAEAALGDREFEVTSDSNPHHIQVRGGELSTLWLKENLLNIGTSRLPPEARYVAFVDADVAFARSNWAQETLHALQHHAVVQMYSTVVYLDHDGPQINSVGSFMDAWLTGRELRTVNGMATCETVPCQTCGSRATQPDSRVASVSQGRHGHFDARP